jgi:hypothetical protein
VLYFEKYFKVMYSVKRFYCTNLMRYLFTGEHETLSSKLLVQCTCNKQQNPAGKFPDLTEALRFFEVISRS